MAYGSHITEPIVTTIGNPVNNQTYAATTVAYDISIGGQPFFLLNDDNSPYRRVTAQYRKQQIDQSREPGEQTLTGWWLRSQSSFHLGQGIKFFEPAQDESLRFQYTYSKGCDVWTKGQVTLLSDTFTTHYTTGQIKSNTRPNQYARSIRWSGTDGILLHDEYDLDKIAVDGTLTHFQDYTSGTDDPVYGVCDDGVYAYWVTNDTASGKLEFNKKILTADTSTAPTVMFTQPGITVTNAVLEYTKERIVAAINDKIYEIATNATTLPTAVYTHPDSDVVFTSITSSGAAIYVSAFSGIQSNIYKFTLASNGTMPTLTSAITAAEMPVGEKIYRISYYLGYMGIGTSQGLRVAAVSDTDGSISYGPLLFESEQAVYDVCFRDKYLWCTTNVDGNPGLTRVDLGQQIGNNLVFAYAWDLYDPDTTGRTTTACAFAGYTTQIIFTTAKTTTNGSIYIQHATNLIENGYLHTGYVRYNTLENKIFKYVVPRFDTTDGGLTIKSIDQFGIEYGLGSYPQGSEIGQVGISYPVGAQQYLAFSFEFSRSSINSANGPTFTGYQLKVLPAIPRQRLIQFPCSLYDSESDKFGNKSGYEGSAYDRLKTLEGIESNGDTIKIEDFRTNESFTGIIEEIDFINRTPTDKRYAGYGGLMLVTIRTIS